MPRVHRAGYAVALNTVPVGNRRKTRVAAIIREYGSELAFGLLLLSLGMAIRIFGTMTW